jgi:hypothetical protein
VRAWLLRVRWYSRVDAIRLRPHPHEFHLYYDI